MSFQPRERTFEKVGGLQEHIQTLKEMVIYPLMYKELFEAHGMEAPRGVLFYGPPGTGKTLVAGAVANECSRCTNKRIAFYMRKGADCLNKYIGESERNLQELFTKAQNTRPSVIFFDEIDGLVPPRSEQQEHHASVVSTLLALMDGLDAKSEVFVIGATNRIDLIDPALRRPGRFDRELYFPLPSLESRYQIFNIHTKYWKSKPDREFLLRLASECAGYCGADIQSLCSQAVMESFRRSYPQVNSTVKKLKINFKKIQVQPEDFWAAKEKIMPTSQRMSTVPSRPLTSELEPLLKRSLNMCLEFIEKSCPFKFIHRNRMEFTKNKSITCPRVLISRKQDKGNIPHLALAILHAFDHLPVTVIDLPTMNDHNTRNSDSGSLVQKIEQARQSMPGIIFFPDIGSWWELIDETGRVVLTSLLEKLDSSISTQLFLLATSNTMEYDQLPGDVRKIFPKNRTLQLTGPDEEEKHNFFTKLIFQKSNFEKPIKEELNIKTEFPTQNRRSRRQQGLEVEYLGMTFDRKTLETLYQIDVKPSFHAHPPTKRKRWTNGAKSPSDSRDNAKMLKMEPISERVPLGDSIWGNDLPAECKSKMEELVRLCVSKTLNESTETVVKLYEQVEILLLRFASIWDKSRLFEELERQITSFNPS